MSKTDGNGWKIAFGVLIGLVLLFLMSGAEIGTNYSEVITDRTYTYNNDVEYNLEETTKIIKNNQLVYLNGINEINTVDLPNGNIELKVNGQGMVVTVTKETGIWKLDLNGIGNVVNLCQGIHSPEIVKNGDNTINYNNC